MFEVNVNKKDIEDINNFLNEGTIVDLMNDFGLSFGAMALVLEGIMKECEHASKEMGVSDVD